MSVGGPAEAQKKRYEEWSDPASGEVVYKTPEHTEKLMRELRQLLKAGRRDRAASPAFLDDLEKAIREHRRADKALAAETSQPAPVSQTPRIADIADDFSDGNYTRNPEWRLVRGEFFVARGNRLFSFVQPQSRTSTNDTEAVVKLFGALLGANTQTRGGGSAEPTAIFLPGEITNAFDLKTQLMSDERTGGVLELGVYQGQDGRIGYRLQFRGDGTAKLLRVGRSVVELRDAKFSFPPRVSGRPGTYEVRWIRGVNGRMMVRVNDELIMDVTDTGFRDDWDGFRLVNAEGRHGMDAIRISMSD